MTVRYFLSVILLVTSFASHARWATIEDSNFVFDHYNKEIQIKRDGSSVEIVEMTGTILKDSARDTWSHYGLVYTEDTDSIEILEAKSEVDNQIFPVYKKFIEDKPLASSPNSFDQLRQVAIAFPQLKIGTKVTLKYKRHNRRPVLNNHFTDAFYYGAGFYEKASKISIHSEIPLNFRYNDPDDHLDIQSDDPQKARNITITLKKPIFKTIVQENTAAGTTSNHYTWFMLSSYDSYKTIATLLGNDYVRVVNQPLPPLHQKIADQAASHKNAYDQINTVTSLLAENIQYVGDWRSVEGRMIPHDLQHIAQHQLGDCKDYAVSCAAILKKLGFKVQVAAISRGLIWRETANALPSVGDFNHVIVKVTTPNKKVLWIDPTNFCSMAEGIFPDIADRKTLLLDPEQPSLEKTPSTHPNRYRSISHEIWDLSQPDLASVKGITEVKGEKAIPFTGAELHASKAAIEQAIMEDLGATHSVTEKSIKIPDLSSRIVRDLKTEYAFTKKHVESYSNAGSVFHLPAPWIYDFTQVKDEQVSDLFIGPKRSFKVRITLKNIQPAGELPLDCTVKTPWLTATRKVKYTKKGITIEDEVKILKNFILNEELHAIPYKALKTHLEQGFRSAIVFSR